MLPEVYSERQRVQRVIAITQSLPVDNDLLRSEWAKYVSIVSCGYIEEAIRLILTEYAKRRAHPTVHKYIVSKLREVQNPRPETLEQLLRAFNPGWVERLDVFWQAERRDSLASIVTNRHHAAHGKHFGTSLATILNYYRQVDEIIVFLHDVVLE